MPGNKRKQSWKVEHQPDSKIRSDKKNGYDNQIPVNDDADSVKTDSPTLMNKIRLDGEADNNEPKEGLVVEKQANGISEKVNRSNGALPNGKYKSQEKPSRQLGFFELYKYADALDILLMFFGTIACMATGAVFPLMMLVYQGVVNSLIPTNPQQVIGTNFTTPDPSAQTNILIDALQDRIKWYVILGFLSIFFFWSGYSFWMITAERQIRRIRFHLFRSIMSQEIGWFDQLNPGTLSNRLVADLDKVRDALGDKKAEFVSLICRLLGGLIFAFIKGWKLSLVFIATSPLTILAFNITMRVIVKYTTMEMQAYSKAGAIAQEVLGAIRTVTAFGGQEKEYERFSNNLVDAKNIGIKKGFFLGICQASAQVAIYTSMAITFWYGPKLVRDEPGNYDPGTVIVIFVSCLQSTFSISMIVPNIQAFAEGSASAVYVFDVISRASKINALRAHGKKPEKIDGNIEFKNVSFTYPARKDTQVLKSVSMKIPSGRTVALVGASGCGKSTSIQLIQRFYDPDDGEILLDGRDIKKLNVAWLRSHIGVVSQEPVLFTGSIEENIRFGKPTATDEEVQQAAKMANAHDFIMDLPDNYKTSSGDKLSGGQKQRVAIARALISNPKILLLDEATSALDNASERIVQDALDRAKEGRTTIVIAHRLSTIRNADLIFAFDKGEIHESGNHDTLMEKKGLYYELVTAQQRKEKSAEDESSDVEDDAQDMDEGKKLRAVSSVSNESAIDIDKQQIDEDAELEVKSRKFCRKPFISKILKLNLPEINWIIVGCITSIIFGCITPLFSLFFTEIYSFFLEPDREKAEILTRNYALAIFFTGFGGGICQGLSTIAFSMSGEALTMRMRQMSFQAMLRQEISWFDREDNSLGALVTRLSSDAASLKGLSGMRIGIIFNAVGAVVCSLVIAFITGWKLTFLILIFVPLVVFSGAMQGKRMGGQKNVKDKKVGKLSWDEQGGMYATEAIDSIRTVVGLHQEKHFIHKYEDCFNNQFKRLMIKIQIQALGIAISNSFMYFIHATSFSYGGSLVRQGEMTGPEVFRVFAVITFGAMSIGRSTAMIPDYKKGKESAIRILKLNQRKTKIDPQSQEGTTLNDVKGVVEFSNVKFIYPSRPKVRVLKDLNLTLNAGATTALCGPSGSGKSTTVALLLRFYDPYQGTVLLDGHDIRTLNLPWLRSQLGFVQQEPVLFNLSVRDNIAYGDTSRTVSDDEIYTAAKKANIHDKIISLPEGYQTSCGAKGSQLSGGEKQRIAIARALIRNPKLLLLDEATSALDVQSERIVQKALEVARSGRTCLTIAHRLATIRDSDMIIVVDHGRIRESGSHDELMEQRGIFYKLNMAQNRSD